eukprot:CAMPEP_0194666518 /NCGR_PEP_ID=MMETSP0295-20121207/2771_1 /TAXON_ID=39354 /ORGANISM="Heterosigma akashiwo, Strain CCMP2393" /LENGTH=70 /DNA_ID=CAMNT_0039548799 /DNA_START=262 /DNA_END=470 /DNA_ORIENTATION=+
MYDLVLYYAPTNETTTGKCDPSVQIIAHQGLFSSAVPSCSSSSSSPSSSSPALAAAAGPSSAPPPAAAAA